MLHGGQLQQAKSQFPHVLQNWIDLSTGINPYAYPFSRISIEYAAQLPSINDEWRLRELAALRYGVKEVNLIAAAPGTQILISLLPYIFEAKQVCILCPTYMEHINSWQQAGILVHQVHSLEEFMGFANQDQIIGIICNPNNPDGRLLNIKQMQEIISGWDCFDNHIIVDEAFMDFEEQSIAALLPHPALTILRSFGKTYGLAGVRLGFLLSDTRIIEKVKAMLGPWSLSGQALQIGLQALQDQEWLLQAKNQLAKQVQQLDKLFINNNCKIVGGTHLFRLVEMKDARIFWKHLANHGIWVRRFDYNLQWLRFGLSQEQDWSKIQNVIKDYFGGC